MAETLDSHFAYGYPPGRGLYLRADDLSQAPDFLARAAEAGFNVVVTDAYAHGEAFFPSAVREDFGLPPVAHRFDPAWWEKLISVALEEGLAFVARFELLRAGATRAPFALSPFRKRFRSWLVRDAKSMLLTSDDERASAWLAPWSRDVLDYLGALAAELCDAYPIDAIWLDDWQLPQALRTQCAIPPAEKIPMPPAPAGSDDPQLEEELQEEPYDSPSETPELKVIAKLLRTFRARGRRGTHFPLLLLGTPQNDIAILSTLIAEGFAEGCVAHASQALALFSAPDDFEGIVWALQDSEHALAETPVALQLVSTMICFPEAFSQLKSEFRAVTGREPLPEFSAPHCAHALEQCLRIAQQADPQLRATLQQTFGIDLGKVLSPSARGAERLPQLVKLLRQHARQTDCPDYSSHDLMWRAIGYAHLLTNYFII